MNVRFDDLDGERHTARIGQDGGPRVFRGWWAASSGMGSGKGNIQARAVVKWRDSPLLLLDTSLASDVPDVMSTASENRSKIGSAVSRANDILTALKTAARGGSVSACFVLGRLYDEGWGVVRNPRAAARWYLRASEGGLLEAYYFIASAYDAGDGVAANGTQALAWYRRAAAAGDRDAKFVLAVRVLEGRGVRKDPAKGMRLLRRVARDDAGAMDYLAYHYLKQGRFSLASKWATRAAKHGESDAAARLVEIEDARRVALTRRPAR